MDDGYRTYIVNRLLHSGRWDVRYVKAAGEKPGQVVLGRW